MSTCVNLSFLGGRPGLRVGAVTRGSSQNYSFLFPGAVGSGIMGLISSVWVREVIDGFSSICSGLVVQMNLIKGLVYFIPSRERNGFGINCEVAQALGTPEEWAGKCRTCRCVDTENLASSKTDSNKVDPAVMGFTAPV